MGRIVTVTHDTSFIEAIVLKPDGNVNPKVTKKTRCLVCIVVQNTEQAEGHIFQDIENVAINHGLPDNKADMPAPIDSDAYTVAQLYRFVKTLPRKKGGIKYSPDERYKYTFNYTKRNDGTKYSLPSQSVAERDRAYMDAVNRGDLDEAQRMVDEAAEEEPTETPARKPGRLKAYTKKEIKKGLAGALIDVLTPIVGGGARTKKTI